MAHHHRYDSSNVLMYVAQLNKVHRNQCDQSGLNFILLDESFNQRSTPNISRPFGLL